MELSVLYIVIFVVITALSGTGIILFVLVKFSRPNPPEKDFSALLSMKEQRLETAVINSENITDAGESDEFRANVLHTPEARIDNETDETLDLAHRFDRGRGEMELMMKLKSQTVDSVVKDRIKKINLDNAGKGNWMRKAKKMGIGKGEVKLSKHLEELANANIRSERYL